MEWFGGSQSWVMEDEIWIRCGTGHCHKSWEQAKTEVGP